MRTYRCVDCPHGQSEHPAGAHGPLPVRCPTHRQVHKARQLRLKRSPLHIVPDGAVAPPAPPSTPPTDPDAEEERPVGPVADGLRTVLNGIFSKHPAAPLLERVAGVLADVLDSPLVRMDPRILPPVSKELCRVVDALVLHEEAESDDLFAPAAPVVVPSA